MKWTLRAWEKTIESLHQQSVQAGYTNSEAVLRPDVIVKGMIRDGVLPEDCDLGRVKFCGLSGLERYAIKIDPLVLEKDRINLFDWVEKHTELNAEDVFNMLRNGAVIAQSMGHLTASCPVINDLVKTMPELSGKKKMAAMRDMDVLVSLSPSEESYTPSLNCTDMPEG